MMITSMQNQQVKQVIRLLDKGSKARRETGLFVAEGRKMFWEAPDSLVERIFVSESVQKEDAPLMRRASSFPYEVVADGVFKAMSDTKTPQGVLTVLRYPVYTPEQLKNPSGLYVVLENLQDPGNLGTILRMGEAAGISGVFLTRGCADVTSPKVIRSTMGSIYRVPFVWVEDVKEAAAFLRSFGITLYAAHLQGELFYDEEDYLAGTAFFIGNEGNGLTEEATRQADRLIKIPMEGKAESLNAAIATSLLCFEAARQRRKAK